MRFSRAIAIGALLCPLTVHAQYFSEGWKPGQPVPSVAPEPNAGYTPGQPIPGPEPTEYQQTQTEAAQKKEEGSKLSPMDLLNPEKLLGTVLNKFGFNITAHLDKNKWDPRIPLITDDNYSELIANEKFESEEEARDRTWVLVVTTGGTRNDPLSKLVDDMVDSAYSKSVEVDDLPHVRWGRIDYFNVTYLTTKWGVWKAPSLVILKDRGQTLHFFQPGSIRIQDDALREFLLTEGYMNLTPWTGLYAPGGEREWLLDIIAVWMTKSYNLFSRIPRWLLLMCSGGLATGIINLLHKPPRNPTKLTKRAAAIRNAQKAAGVQPAADTAAASPARPVPAATQGSSTSTQKTPASPSPVKRTTRQRNAKKAVGQ